MSILQQVSDKMQTILRPLADQAAVETGMVKRKPQTHGECPDANPGFRVVRKSRGKLP